MKLMSVQKASHRRLNSYVYNIFLIENWEYIIDELQQSQQTTLNEYIKVAGIIIESVWFI